MRSSCGPTAVSGRTRPVLLGIPTQRSCAWLPFFRVLPGDGRINAVLSVASVRGRPPIHYADPRGPRCRLATGHSVQWRAPVGIERIECRFGPLRFGGTRARLGCAAAPRVLPALGVAPGPGVASGLGVGTCLVAAGTVSARPLLEWTLGGRNRLITGTPPSGVLRRRGRRRPVRGGVGLRPGGRLGSTDGSQVVLESTFARLFGRLSLIHI